MISLLDVEKAITALVSSGTKKDLQAAAIAEGLKAIAEAISNVAEEMRKDREEIMEHTNDLQ